LRDLIMEETTLTIHSVTEENRSNIPKRTLARWHRRYGGTRIGEQELGGRILGSNDNAIAAMTTIEANRVEDCPELDETGVALDPAVSTKRRSDDTGAIACGRFGGARGSLDAHLCVLEDRSGRYKPDGWADVGAELARAWGAKWIAVERNKIGDVGAALLIHALKRYDLYGQVEIREAYSFKDKWTRAQPVSALYDRGHVHHVGRFPDLESQLSQWDPSTGRVSPNNLDALVHCAIELMGLTLTESPVDLSTRWEGFAEINRRFEVRNRDLI
jgi:phage terminase large subunit-like protein